MTPTIAYLSQGRLLVKLPGQRPREVQSAFAKETAERQARSRSIDGWKGRSGVWGQMGMAPPEWSQWEEAGMEGQRRIAFRSVCRGPASADLMYVLDLQSVSGVFRYDLAQSSERRLMHRNDFVAGDLVCHREKGTLAQMINSDRMFDADASAAYAESWALTFYLVETLPREYMRYLAVTAARPGFEDYPAAQRLADFTSIFGSNLDLVETKFLRYMSELK